MIYITGDTHIPHDIGKLNSKSFPNQKVLTKDDFVIICGDFGGVWDNSRTDLYWRKWLSEKNFTTLFVDGNHENFHLLNEFQIENRFGGKVHVIAPDLYHLMRGEVFNIDGQKIFCMGGAASHDKMFRVQDINWWEEEMPTMQEMEYALKNLERNDWKVDYIVTHCAPKDTMRSIQGWYENDAMTSFLQEVDSRCQYKHWYFGHYHTDKVIDDKHTVLYQKIKLLGE